MGYDGTVSSGTDDDDDIPPPPTYQNRGNRVRSSLGSAPYSRVHTNIEAEIHRIEQEAYCSVLRAFKAQSDTISWEKESLITELRKELQVSDDEHRELLSRVNADDIIRMIRDWRLTGGTQVGRHNGSYEVLPTPSLSGSLKKQKTSQLQGQLAPVNTMPYLSAAPDGNRQFTHRNSSGSLPRLDPEEDPWIGKKVWTRWPEDNNFYEAVITDYNPVEGSHYLVYDQKTPNETWEWVNLKEIPADGIRWQAGEPGIAYRGGYGGRSCGVKKTKGGPILGAGRRSGPTKGQARKEQNDVAKQLPDHIELFNTQALVQEAERLLKTSNPSSIELAKYRKILKEQEEALVGAISMLPDLSDSESVRLDDDDDDGDDKIFHVQFPGFCLVKPWFL
ncbi:hypothetical protein ACFE04_020648 [Oxalis oulophora]